MPHRQHRLYSRRPVCKVRSSNPDRVKPMNHKVDTCSYLAWNSALLEDWLTQDPDYINVGNADHGAGGLVSQWGSTIKSP